MEFRVWVFSLFSLMFSHCLHPRWSPCGNNCKSLDHIICVKQYFMVDHDTSTSQSIPNVTSSFIKCRAFKADPIVNLHEKVE